MRTRTILQILLPNYRPVCAKRSTKGKGRGSAGNETMMVGNEEDGWMDPIPWTGRRDDCCAKPRTSVWKNSHGRKSRMVALYEDNRRESPPMSRGWRPRRSRLASGDWERWSKQLNLVAVPLLLPSSMLFDDYVVRNDGGRASSRSGCVR